MAEHAIGSAQEDRSALHPMADSAVAGARVGDFIALLKPRVMSLVVFSGFAGLDAYALKKATTLDVIGYDAGSENNNEKKGFLGALGGGNERDPENGVITKHTGIRGDADAPKAWNWDVSKPVAHITITPLN